MVAAGGVAVDVWDDHAFLLPPLGTADVVRALRSLRVWPLLDGFRGAEPAAVDELARLVADVARLAVDVPELAELDLNPVMVSPSGVPSSMRRSAWHTRTRRCRIFPASCARWASGHSLARSSRPRAVSGMSGWPQRTLCCMSGSRHRHARLLGIISKSQRSGRMATWKFRSRSTATVDG